MTTETTNAFAPLQNEQFVVLTTHRRDGTPVPTTVWFATQGDKVYVTTQNKAGKAKRIGANPAVTLQPSDQVGNVHGDVIAASARVLAAAEAAVAEQALRDKYPQYDEVAGRMLTSSDEIWRVFIEVVA